MQEPFCSIPLLWFIHEDTLGKRLQLYASSDWQDLISDWRSTFKRADVVVFPDFSLPVEDCPVYFVVIGGLLSLQERYFQIL